MREYLTLGPVPCDEECQQVGLPDYDANLARTECKRYADLLRSLFPNPPSGSSFSVKTFAHDFGNYQEVVIWFDGNDQPSVDFAFNVEANLPSTWEG